MKSLVVALFCSCLISTHFFQVDGRVSIADVTTFDPESLYQHYSRVWREDRLSNAPNAEDYPLEGPAPGIAYFTRATQLMTANHTMSSSSIISAFNSITSAQKTDLSNSAKNLGECWRKQQTESQGRPDETVENFCYFNWNNDCQQLYGHQSLVKGGLELKLVECVAQAQPQFLRETLNATDVANPQAVHVEFGYGFSAFLYYSGATGVAFDIPDREIQKVTATNCWGVKFDVSVGGGVSVSYLRQMSDLLGQAVTVEIGVDVPGTEGGIDLLLHFGTGGAGLVGFGFAFGMGVGLNPVDFASSNCNTRLVAEYQNSVKIAIGYAGSSWECRGPNFGVVSEDKYVCCPASNPGKGCHVERCWFDGKNCPISPADEYAKATSRSMARALAFSNCLGRRYLDDKHSFNECYHEYQSDRSVRYMVWKVHVQECWMSNSLSLGTCSWAPSYAVSVRLRASGSSNETIAFDSEEELL